MPELPEVETVARTLREGLGAPSLIGRTLQSAQVLWEREIGNLKARDFERQVAGMRVQQIGRHGKYLLINLASVASVVSTAIELERTTPTNRTSEIVNRRSLTMLVHLKMSGRLEVVPQADAFTKHARVVWLLDDRLALRFDDTRKFGRVWLVEDPVEIIGQLGPDALYVSEAHFVERLQTKKRAIKPLLLDQTFIAGVGNIYADESLHRAGLHPQRLSNTIGDAAARRLFETIRLVLEEGIRANGASFDWVYPGGSFQENFRVYGMTDKPCPTCGEPIRRILVGQRSTHFCPKCQV